MTWPIFWLIVSVWFTWNFTIGTFGVSGLWNKNSHRGLYNFIWFIASPFDYIFSNTEFSWVEDSLFHLSNFLHVVSVVGVAALLFIEGLSLTEVSSAYITIIVVGFAGTVTNFLSERLMPS